VTVPLGHGGDGKRVRRKVQGKTKQDVRLKLKSLRSEIEARVRAPATYGSGGLAVPTAAAGI
jgi:hypothetical protein